MEKNDYTLKELGDLEYRINYGKRLLREFLISSLQDNDIDEFLSETGEETSAYLYMTGLSPSEQQILEEELDRWNNLSEKRRIQILEKLKAEIGHDPILRYETLSDETFKNDISLDSAFAEFIQYTIDYNERIKKSIPAESINEYRSIYNEFTNIIGTNLNCSQLNKDIIRQYEDSLWKIPAGYDKRKKYKGKNIQEILKMDVPEEEKRSASTFNKYVLRINQFLKFLSKKGYIQERLDDQLNRIPDAVISNKKRDKFADDELRLLFNNEIYEKYRFPQDRPSIYWLPLLALFTGARGEELAQLFADDIKKDKATGIYYIHFQENTARKQKLKNRNAFRKHPIHEKLISLGFLDYVKTKEPDLILFPEIDISKKDYNSDDNKRGKKRYKKFGNKYNRRDRYGIKWQLGVKSEMVAFHSFRHNVIDFFSESNVHKKHSCYLVGQKYDGEGLVSNYIKPSDMETLKSAIDKLNYPSIDWTKIKKKKW